MLGYPILSIDRFPKTRAGSIASSKKTWKKGRIDGPLEVTDVWPENYSAKLGAEGVGGEVRGASPERGGARSVVVKCGHDAPTYGLVDSIISASATRIQRSTTSTPTSRADRSRFA